MNKKLLWVITSCIACLSLPQANAQVSLEERRKYADEEARRKNDFKVFLNKTKETVGLNPINKKQSIVEIYEGVLQNAGSSQKIIVQYMPEGKLMETYFMINDAYGNVFYSRTFVNEWGIPFTNEFVNPEIERVINYYKGNI